MGLYLVSKKSSEIEQILSNLGYTGNFVGTATSSQELPDHLPYSIDSDIVIADMSVDNPGKLPRALLVIRQKHPATQIYLLTGNVNTTNANNKKIFDALKNQGIDIIPGNPDENTWRRIANISVEKAVDAEETSSIPTSIDIGEDVSISDTPNNLFMISSPKAGSGKSFVSSNLAYMLALYGKRRDGKRPTVLLLDGDLQTLSVSNLLGISDNRHNLKNVLEAISDIVSYDGVVTGTPQEQERVFDIIAKSCLQVDDKYDNLFAMVSSTFSLAEREKMSPFYYFYLIQVLTGMFDIVLVDSNSATEHKTTGPIMQVAREIFMVVTADFEGIRVAQKTMNDLEDLRVDQKTVFILNKCITKVQRMRSTEKSVFNPEKYLDQNRIVARIPFVDQVIQYNRLYEKKPLVLDKSPDTLVARIAFTRLAKNIWPMDNMEDLEREVQALKQK